VLSADLLADLLADLQADLGVDLVANCGTCCELTDLELLIASLQTCVLNCSSFRWYWALGIGAEGATDQWQTWPEKPKKISSRSPRISTEERLDG